MTVDLIQAIVGPTCGIEDCKTIEKDLVLQDVAKKYLIAVDQEDAFGLEVADAALDLLGHIRDIAAEQGSSS
jgi:hypothetical protein